VLNQFKPGDDNLKANLEKLTASLGGYLKFYKRSYTILYPVYFGLGLLFGGLETGSDAFFQKLSNPKLIAGLFLLAITFFVVSRYFANWLLKKLYGNHLSKLNSLLQELNTVEEAE
jgi:hypothetical protein